MRLFTLICICVTGVWNLVYAAEDDLVLPAAIQAVVQREFAGAKVTQVDEGEYEGIDVYEIEGETPAGRELEIEVGYVFGPYTISELVKIFE